MEKKLLLCKGFIVYQKFNIKYNTHVNPCVSHTWFICQPGRDLFWGCCVIVYTNISRGNNLSLVSLLGLRDFGSWLGSADAGITMSFWSCTQTCFIYQVSLEPTHADENRNGHRDSEEEEPQDKNTDHNNALCALVWLTQPSRPNVMLAVSVFC